MQWQEAEAEIHKEVAEAEEEQAIEELLRECQEKAYNYEPGGATTVEKSPGLAPGRADYAGAKEGSDCASASQPDDSEVREAGVAVSQCRG